MKITITLGEVLKRCSDWNYFCKDQGFNVHCVQEGGEDIEITLSEKETLKYEIIKQ